MSFFWVLDFGLKRAALTPLPRLRGQGLGVGRRLLGNKMRFMKISAGPQWKRFLLRGLLVLILCGGLRGRAFAAGTIEKQADGTYLLTGTGYQARISLGMLYSLQVGGAEFLDGPLLAGSVDWKQLKPENWQIVKTETPQPGTLKFTLALPSAPQTAVLSMTYRDSPEGLRVIMERLTDSWGGNVGWHTGHQVVAVEPLARPGFGYLRLPGNGLVYALPVAGLEAIRDMRYYFDNRCALDATYLLDDAAYNRQSNGQLVGSAWGRGLLDRRPLEMIFAPVRPHSVAPATDAANAPPPLRKMPAVVERGLPFTVSADTPEAMFPVGKPAAFRLKFRPDALWNGPQTLIYRTLDFQDKETARGTQTIAQTNLKDGACVLEISPKNTGWYRLIASLRPAGQKDALPSEGEAAFGIYTPRPQVTAPPTAFNVAGITGAIGLRCLRLSLYFNSFFPSREKSPVSDPKYDWKPMDDQALPFFADCAKYHVTGFFQLNNRPEWADPAAFEALIHAIVAHYKTVNHYWEIENEPQDRYTPENYVKQALAPAFRGAHDADPAAQIMGPAIVRVDLPWFKRFFDAKGSDSLDIISTHAYTGHDRGWEEHGNVEDIRALQALMQSRGFTRPIWQTEEGFTWHNHAEMPRLHAAYVVRMFALAASVGIPNEHCYYFYSIYNGFEPWYLFEGVPNRSGMATRIYAEQTAGMKFQREIPMGKFAHAIVYTNGKQDTIVCWLDDFSADVRFHLPTNVRPQIADIMGAPVLPESDKPGLLTLKLNGFPRYIHVPRGTAITPLDRFPAGTNLADAKTGAVGAASSYAGTPADAANLNDGTWHFDDGQTEQKIWVGKPDAPMPQWAGVWFPAPRRIDTIAAVTPSSNVGLPGARHYLLQAEINGEWKTMREVRNNTLEWVLYAHFPPVSATAVRVVFLDLNNGWWREDKTKFSDMSARVYELEAYGR